MRKSLRIRCDYRCEYGKPEQESCTQMEELPLSEGFHWESIPDSPSSAPSTGLPPPVRDTPRSESLTQPQSSPLTPEASRELPEQEENRRQTVAVKVEPNPAEEHGAVADRSTAETRENTVVAVSKPQSSIDGRPCHSCSCEP